jgi:uncharacterized protein (UPF0335 family)
MRRSRFEDVSPRERLVAWVQRLESLTAAKQEAAADLAGAFKEAQREGFDPATLKVVLKLRQLTPSQRRQRRALEAIYMAALGLLDGDPLPDSARRRLDGKPDEPPSTPPAPPPSESHDPDAERPATDDAASAPEKKKPEQAPLVLKDPDEARQEGAAAAAAGKRIYDNPFPAGDPCRAAWDEGWCAQRKSHGMDPPEAYQRRSEKKPDKDEQGDSSDKDQKGAA